MPPRAVPIDLATQYLGCWEDRSLNGAEDVLTNPDWDMGPFASVHVDPARYQDGVIHFLDIVGDDVSAFLVDFSRLLVDNDASRTAEGAAVSAHHATNAELSLALAASRPMNSVAYSTRATRWGPRHGTIGSTVGGPPVAYFWFFLLLLLGQMFLNR
uniref:Uncharacterized protein n=1 Tax=Peronospora matthiolae TaxID=2874970 RepID=A0AAV1U2U5_9STRA